MFLPRLKQRFLCHHIPLLLLCSSAVAILFVTRPYRDTISRASFATAYPALILLTLTLLLGPWRVLRGQSLPLSYDLRRDIGIWAGILSTLHAVVGQCVHLRGRPWLYYVYPAGSHPGFPLRHDQFGIENFSGLFSALIVLALFATSSDLLLRRLGPRQWKRLQRWNYAAFAFAGVHTILYQWNEKAAQGMHALGFTCLAVAILMQAAALIARLRAARES
ncbi:ferric reductase-like transmembrane domain-containing protein [Terriglobus roseus]|uniref:Sulfoxide reductase heme-binding subunit YedZ n=1 Tax=Terriglobus roseus TaxID=392734 RepID=A0A1H4LMR3_9BACT|nr:ferric reductase-like transmembrane domain-containing protein [Terriglobus roseus]SEB71927.1 sulfoxide reductase heme-binding subunit YedZ [Terriglobus roseus]